jgi:hypothetical protein
MSFLNLWQEARGNVLRRRYEGLKARIDTADATAKSACFGVVKSHFEFLSSRYASASGAERKRVLKQASMTLHQLSDASDWPRALGLTIIMLNLEARHLPGDDAAALKAATDALIREANTYIEPRSPGRTDTAIEAASGLDAAEELHDRLPFSPKVFSAGTGRRT